MRGVILLICMLVIAVSGATAQVIRIPHDHPTIQAGISAAREGDTLIICEGTYYENINFLGKAITVASHFLLDGDTSHISKTIINGSRSANPDTASVVTLWSGEDTTSVLCGLTITGGRGTLLNHIHTELLDSLFGIGPKTAYMGGGGILLYNSGGKIVHNIVENNQLIPGGPTRGSLGVGILAVVNHQHYAVIRNNLIRNNRATQRQCWGGGIGINGGGVLVEGNSILYNTIQVKEISAGAGIAFENEKATGTIERVTIRNNLILGNAAHSSAFVAAGGGISLSLRFDSARIQIVNNLIAMNYAEDYGGGLYGFGSKADVSGNLIFDNGAGQAGEDIWTEYETDFDMKGNHIWSGNLWIATYDGVARLRPGEGQIGNYGRLFSIDPATGEIFIGAVRGMISFNPERLPLTTFAASKVLLDYHSYRQQDSGDESVVPKGRAEQPDRLDLLLKDNYLEYEFAPFDTSSPTGLKYSYLMSKMDMDMVTAQDPRPRAFGDMRPGRYTFWSSRVGEDGTPYTESITMEIRIHPPWYRNGITIGSYALFMILVVFGTNWIRTSRLRREKRLLEEEVEKRTAELREKNEQIVEMERLKIRFFSDISHEIRTPLSLITGPLDNLIIQDHPDPRTHDWLAMIRRNSHRLLQLVNQLLDISRLDSGHIKLILEESDVVRHLRVLVSEYFSLAESRNIRFVVDVPDDVLIAWNDRDKINKITSNLLSNAFKFTPENGTVTCRAKLLYGDRTSPDPALRIIVADTGPGIPLEERERIFQRFYRLDAELNDSAGGTGIGLSLTRELVSLMHGEVTVKSIEGKGAVFIVTFPLGKEHLSQKEYILKEPVNQEPALFAPEIGSGDSRHMGRVEDQKVELLVVEDNADLRTFIRENLSSRYHISEAGDGIRGLEAAQAKLPDLIITDVMMPGMDGMELCRKLKTDERTSHIPVILLTARSTSKDKIEGFEQGADDYIYKPFSIEELIARIGNLLEQRERLKRKYASLIGIDWGKMTVTTLDDHFLKKVAGILSENILNFEFHMGILQQKMAMSREHLSRKLKALTGETPSSLLRVMRLKTAASFLEKGGDNITAISLNAGFTNPSYFAQCFKQYYGRTPKEYQKSFAKNQS